MRLKEIMPKEHKKCGKNQITKEVKKVQKITTKRKNAKKV